MVGGRVNPLQVAQLVGALALFLAQTVLLETWRLRTFPCALLSSSQVCQPLLDSALSQLSYISHCHKVLYIKVHPGSYPSSKH